MKTKPQGVHCPICRPAGLAALQPKMSDSDIWHLYMVRCADGSLYTGIAIDVARRLREHEAGRGARRLRGRGPLALVFNEAVGDRSHALRLEHRVKRLRRSQKELLISGDLGLGELLR